MPDPDFAYGYASLARAFLGLEKARDSEKVIHRALELEPNNGHFHRLLAIAFRLQKKLRAARKSVDQSLSLSPWDYYSHIESGRCWLACRRFNQA